MSFSEARNQKNRKVSLSVLLSYSMESTIAIIRIVILLDDPNLQSLNYASYGIQCIIGVAIISISIIIPIICADVSGKIRIWDTTQKEHILKYEYQPISGKIKDIVWSPDSKRIAVCGEGREK